MKMTLDEVYKEIDRLNVIRRELESKEQERYDAKAAQYVGKCYRYDDGRVFKILGIPVRTCNADFRCVYRKHSFPALLLQYVSPIDEDCCFDELSPCYCDEIYFDIQFDKPLGTTEITQEEFNAEFDKCIAHFKELINI